MAYGASAQALADLIKQFQDAAVLAHTGVTVESNPLRDAMILAQAQAIAAWMVTAGVAAISGTTAPGGGPFIAVVT